MALALGLISRVGVGACSICSVGCFPWASLGSFSGQRLPCILGVHLRMSSWLCLAQRSVMWRFGVLSSISVELPFFAILVSDIGSLRRVSVSLRGSAVVPVCFIFCLCSTRVSHGSSTLN